MQIIKVLLVIGCFWVLPFGYAAGFDCSKVNDPTNKAVCKNPKLSKLDDELNSVYREALKKSKEKKVLQKEQRNWLNERRIKALTDYGLEAAYESRLDDLNRIINDSKDSHAPKYTLMPLKLTEIESYNSLDNGVCNAMLNVINTTSREVIYKDIFLDFLEKHKNFSSLKRIPIKSDIDKYENIIEKFNIKHRPKRGINENTYLDMLRKSREGLGGYDYFIADANLIEDYENKVSVELLIYVSKNIDEKINNKRIEFIILNEAKTAPNDIFYKSVAPIASRLFKYKNIYFRFHFDENDIYIFEYKTYPRPTCHFALTKNRD